MIVTIWSIARVGAATSPVLGYDVAAWLLILILSEPAAREPRSFKRESVIGFEAFGTTSGFRTTALEDDGRLDLQERRPLDEFRGPIEILLTDAYDYAILRRPRQMSPLFD
ncbi:hypothetical protein K469DRAFT_696835 [Zopfia rhizophila CBS 207.26]|uniref:Uncharacterized protein n=1 Tax=Zopfia rhizophila CBS 207.26 TaxID=1314779 RepID=A0A6A6EHB6_9PEZI|nr:hypothetical protein K469DRAFT_696835 [Zopfia rhizophila CBS 207.26]